MNAHGIFLQTYLTIVLASACVSWSFQGKAQGNAAAHDDLNSQATARVRDLFRKGVAAFNAKKFEEARARLLEAWAVRQTPDVAAMLGQTELRLGRHRDAAEHLDYCLRNVAAAESDDFITKVRAGFDKAKNQVGLLRVNVNRDGAEVKLDGRAIGVSPIKQTLYVDPGEHLVEASLDGAAGNDPVNAEAGKEFSAEVTLPAAKPVASAPPVIAPPSNATPLPNPAAMNPTPKPIALSEESHRSIVPVIIGGAVFAVGVGTGVGFRLASNAKYHDAKALRDTVGRSGCVTGAASQSDCVKLLSAAQSGDRDRNWSTVGFIAAGTAVVATSIYLMWPQSRSNATGTSKSRWQLESGIGRQFTGVLLSGEF